MEPIPPLWLAPPAGARTASLKTLLTPAHRRKLAAIATRLELRARMPVYQADAQADSVFIVGDGVIKAVHDLPSGRQQIVSFWFARDVFGLAEDGRYVYTTIAVTPVTVYRLPIETLRRVLLDDSYLQFQFLTKITHEFRESQRQKLVLIRRDAVGRVAMFLSMLARQQRGAGGERAGGIAVPMSRSDIAAYLGLTLEAVSRATRRLVGHGVIAIPERRVVRILDPRRFEQLVAKI